MPPGLLPVGASHCQEFSLAISAQQVPMPSSLEGSILFLPLLSGDWRDPLDLFSFVTSLDPS